MSGIIYMTKDVEAGEIPSTRRHLGQERGVGVSGSRFVVMKLLGTR